MLFRSVFENNKRISGVTLIPTRFTINGIVNLNSGAVLKVINGGIVATSADIDFNANGERLASRKEI